MDNKGFEVGNGFEVDLDDPLVAKTIMLNGGILIGVLQEVVNNGVADPDILSEIAHHATAAAVDVVADESETFVEASLAIAAVALNMLTTFVGNLELFKLHQEIDEIENGGE